MYSNQKESTKEVNFEVNFEQVLQSKICAFLEDVQDHQYILNIPPAFRGNQQ